MGVKWFANAILLLLAGHDWLSVYPYTASKGRVNWVLDHLSRLWIVGMDEKSRWEYHPKPGSTVPARPVLGRLMEEVTEV